MRERRDGEGKVRRLPTREFLRDLGAGEMFLIKALPLPQRGSEIVATYTLPVGSPVPPVDRERARLRRGSEKRPLPHCWPAEPQPLVRHGLLPFKFS